MPGVGWIFSLRRPVRGIVSRKTIQKAKQDDKTAKPDKKVQKAIAEATASAMERDSTKRRRRRGGRGRDRAAKTEESEPEAVNEPATFLQFVIDHRLGTEVSGEVDSFASHGAFVLVDGVKCYVPLSAMGNPQPSRARDVLTKGDKLTFVVQAVDAPRRGIELGLPGFATVAGAPSEETVAAEVGHAPVEGEEDRAREEEGAAKATKKKSAEPPTATEDAADAKPAKRSRRGRQQTAKQQPAKQQAATPATKVTKKVAKGAAKTPPAMAEPPAKKAKATKQPAKQKSTKKSAKSTAKTAPAKAAKQTSKAAAKASKTSTKKTAKSSTKQPAKAASKSSEGRRRSRSARPLGRPGNADDHCVFAAPDPGDEPVSSFQQKKVPAKNVEEVDAIGGAHSSRCARNGRMGSRPRAGRVVLAARASRPGARRAAARDDDRVRVPLRRALREGH